MTLNNACNEIARVRTRVEYSKRADLARKTNGVRVGGARAPVAPHSTGERARAYEHSPPPNQRPDIFFLPLPGPGARAHTRTLDLHRFAATPRLPPPRARAYVDRLLPGGGGGGGTSTAEVAAKTNNSRKRRRRCVYVYDTTGIPLMDVSRTLGHVLGVGRLHGFWRRVRAHERTTRPLCEVCVPIAAAAAASSSPSPLWIFIAENT